MAEVHHRGEDKAGMGEACDWHIDADMWAEDSGDIGGGESEGPRKRRSRNRTTAVLELSEQYLYRRAWSETQVLDMLGMDGPKDGVSYHVLTGGEIDQMAWARVMLRYHRRLDDLYISSWVISGEEVMWLDQRLELGDIGRLTILTGEIFRDKYRIEYQMCCTMIGKYDGRVRVYSYPNHAKILAGRNKERFFVVESSANCNTNRRLEQAVVSTAQGLYEFYAKYFEDLINGEEKDT